MEGGLPLHSEASRASRRGFERFEASYPHLAKVLKNTPGKSSRTSYAKETGGRRVARGLRGQGLEPVAEETEPREPTEAVLDRIREDLRSNSDTAGNEAEEAAGSEAPTNLTRSLVAGQ